MAQFENQGADSTKRHPRRHQRWALTRPRSIIGAPSLDSERESAAASLLNTSSWLTLAGASVFEAFQIYEGVDLARVTAVGVVALLAVAALCLLRLKLVRPAAWLVTSTIFSMSCASIWLGGGIQAPGVVSLMIVLIMSAMALEWQPTIVWTVLSIVVVSGFAFAESLGWLPPQGTRRPLIELWFIYAFHLAAAAWLVTYSAGAVRGILGRLGARTTALADSEKRYMQLVEQSPDVILAIDADGIIMECSPAITSLFGHRPDEVIGRSFRELGVMPESSIEENLDAFRSLMTGELPGLRAVQVVHKDGSHRWVEANPRVVRREDGTDRLYVVIRDTTARVDAEQRRVALEQQLAAAGRLEALGRMAGGLAHDFNNLLLVILANVELLQSDSDSASELLLRDIQVAGKAAADLIAQLLAFAGQRVQDVGAADVDASLSKIEGLIRRLLPANVSLVIHASRDLPAVGCDPVQLEQVIVNLVLNAQQAMPDGGAIAIETSSVHVEEAECAQHAGALPGDHVRIAVTDTGTGIDDATIRRIFEPFFSTRDRGNGLGLATVHGTVSQSGGHIRVYSRSGEGTRFEVLLPCVQQPVSAERPALSPAPFPRSREVVALVVDDEPAVLSSVSRLLERGGFRVLTADCLEAARAVSGRETAGIDVLVTDVIMPGTSGPKLAAELLAARPGMKILLMSGYTEDYLDHDEVLRGAVSFISKPFSGETLVQKIRSILRDSDAGHRPGHPSSQTTSTT